jgi:hypothetical protein
MMGGTTPVFCASNVAIFHMRHSHTRQRRKIAASGSPVETACAATIKVWTENSLTRNNHIATVVLAYFRNAFSVFGCTIADMVLTSSGKIAEICVKSFGNIHNVRRWCFTLSHREVLR